MFLRLRTFCLILLVASAGTAVAKDAYYDVPLRDLKPGDLGSVDGSRPTEIALPTWRGFGPAQPYATIDGEGEAYLNLRDRLLAPMPSDSPVDDARILIRAPAGKDVAGRLVVPKSDQKSMAWMTFTVASSAAKSEAKTPFYQTKIAHYENLANRDIPGGAWFRHQVRVARAELRLEPNQPQPPNVFPQGGRSDELTRTFDLFTGGRAMSENLQLDRALPRTPPNENPVKIASLRGITVNAIDWKPLIKDAHPKLDALAQNIPADQHVVFFPSFAAAVAIADETNRHDTPVLAAGRAALENVARGRALSDATWTVDERAGPAAGAATRRERRPDRLRSVLPPGDRRGGALRVAAAGNAGEALAGPHRHRRRRGRGGKARKRRGRRGEISRVSLAGSGRVKLRRPPGWSGPRDQFALSVAAAGGDAQGQIEVDRRIARVHLLPHPLSAGRSRGDGAGVSQRRDDSAMVRAAMADRRLAPHRARAVLAELQASQLDALVKRTAKPGPIYTDLPIPDGGELTLLPAGVRSSTLGSLDFMTPIGEVPLDEATEAEANAYSAWRDGYQRNWSWGFDPIALRISLGKRKVAADVTVTPLILNSEYREFASISLGGKFDPTAGDPHDALAQLILAIDHDSPMFKRGENLASMTGKAVSLGWIGRWATIYVDDDPFWEDSEKVGEDKIGKFMEKNVNRFPLALRIDVPNPLQTAVFLSTVRAFVEQTAPGLTQWESLKYKDQPYVRITPIKGRGTLGELENIAIYYTPLGGALTATLSEKVLDRSIDRWLAEEKARAEGKPVPATAKPWLGANVALRATCKIFEVLNAVESRSVSASDAGAVLGQPADPQRVEAALSGSRPRGSAPAGLGSGACLPGRGEVRVERQVSHDGLDRLRPSRRAERGPSGPARVERVRRRKLRPDV